MSDLDLVPIEYKQPEGLRTLANYLRSQNGIKVRSGIEHEKRVDFFKGISCEKDFKYRVNNFF